MPETSTPKEGVQKVAGVVLGPVLRSLFIERKSALMRKPYRPNPRFDSHDFWTQVGSLCSELGASPNQFMTALFDECRERQGPFPNTLHGAWARKAWNFWAAKNQVKVAAAQGQQHLDVSDLSSMLREVYQEACRLFGGDMIQAVRSPVVTCPPYLRLLLAPDDEQVWEAWGSQGLPDILNNPELVRQAYSLNLPVGRILTRHNHAS